MRLTNARARRRQYHGHKRRSRKRNGRKVQGLVWTKISLYRFAQTTNFIVVFFIIILIRILLISLLFIGSCTSLPACFYPRRAPCLVPFVLILFVVLFRNEYTVCLLGLGLCGVVTDLLFFFIAGTRSYHFFLLQMKLLWICHKQLMLLLITALLVCLLSITF